MTTRERILTALRFGAVDVVPWAPRWELWLNAARRDGRLPAKYHGWHIYDIARAYGLGIKGYGVKPFVEDSSSVPSLVRHEGDDTVLEYDTPYGKLTQVTRATAELETAGVRGRVMKEFVTERGDYDAALYLVEHTRLVPKHDDVAAELRRIGEDGVTLAMFGHPPAHHVMREFVGYEGFYYQLQDNADKLEQLIALFNERQGQVEAIAADCPAQVVEFDGNYDGWLTPPPVYRRYFLQPHQRFAQRCHAAGKLVASHMDGRNDGLLGLLLESGFDVAEAFTPPPMTNIGVGDARQVWDGHIAIWGGLAATAFTSQFSGDEFDAHVYQALDQSGGRGLVLGTGDNVPTDGLFDRVLRAGQLAEQWSRDRDPMGGPSGTGDQKRS